MAWNWKTLCIVCLLAAAVSTPMLYRWGTDWLSRQWLARAEAALDRTDFAEAERYALRVLSRDENQSARVVAGAAAMALGRDKEAIEYFEPLCDGTDADAIAAQVASAQLYKKLGNARAAERLYRQALQLQPEQTYALHGLAELYAMQGRRPESIPLLFRLLKMGDFTEQELLLLGDPRGVIEGEEVEWFAETDAENPMWWLACAQVDFRNSRFQSALSLFRKLVAARPDIPDGQAGLGLALLDIDSPEQFWTWHQQVPETARSHPDYWMAIGLWAMRHQQRQAGIRCFWEALRRDPTYRSASYQLSVALVMDGKPQVAKPFEQLAVKLRLLVKTIDSLATWQRGNPVTMQKAADELEALGRLWEASAWHVLLLRSDPQNLVSQRALGRLRERLRPDLPRILAEHRPADAVDFSSYPLPDIPRPAVATHQQVQEANTDIRFADVTESSGLQFSYFNGEDLETPGRRMFEFTGGGVAVLDYDVDGWPDLYFTQGAHYPRREKDPVLRDQLFRNLGNGRFQNVTGPAGLGDERFSQGVTAGDFNADGYPDLLVANAGPNRLYRNNGDGTFTEVTDQAGLQGDFWTTSCVIADLTGDGLADIYEVNYLAGNVKEMLCPRTCSPASFPAESDRFFLNQGDGTFVNQTVEAGFNGQDGKGLAVVAFDYNDSGQLSLFVSNDTTANFFYVNDQPRGATPQFAETALIRGLAFDREGQGQACMGIGVNDANGDGLLDIFVANFHREFNVLYEQMPGGFFADVSRERGLAEPSYLLLSFGTEFMDMDLDGDPDIICTNGHVDDFRSAGIPYQMPPTVYDNLGDGDYAELGKTCGPFFEGAYLGRGLAALDWNRDGRPDWTVSHLDSPAAILENCTEPCGHYVGLRFVGIESDRNAFGTTCWVTVGDRTTMQQLVGGGGYENCNEPLLLFGLGNAKSIDKLEVKWPSGQRMEFQGVSGDRVYRLIEGRNQLQEVPRD